MFEGDGGEWDAKIAGERAEQVAGIIWKLFREIVILFLTYKDENYTIFSNS